MTPTAPTTIQLGLVFYDLIYMPLRTAVFFAVLVLGLDVRFDAAGLLPATVVLLLFVPFVWGLGIILSAATITFKQGGAGLLGSLWSSRRAPTSRSHCFRLGSFRRSRSTTR